MKLPGNLIQAITFGVGISSMTQSCNTNSEPFIANNLSSTSLIFKEKTDSPAVDTLTLPMTANDSLELRIKQMYPFGAGTHYYCPACGRG